MSSPASRHSTASAGHRQRHARPTAGILAVVPVANQQKRKNAGQLPKESQLQHIAAESTTPITAPIKANKKEKNRDTGSAGDM